MSQLNVLRTVFKQIARVLMIKPVKARVRPPVQLVARRHFRCLCKQSIFAVIWIIQLKLDFSSTSCVLSHVEFEGGGGGGGVWGSVAPRAFELA